MVLTGRMPFSHGFEQAFKYFSAQAGSIFCWLLMSNEHDVVVFRNCSVILPLQPSIVSFAEDRLYLLGVISGYKAPVRAKIQFSGGEGKGS